MDFIKENGPMGPSEVADGLGKNISTVKTLIGKMEKGGILVSQDGKYRLPDDALFDFL